MKRCIILNPWAGRGLAGKYRSEIEQALHNNGVSYELISTHAHGGATELTYQAIERGYDQIIAIGGDGTINEILNGILGCKESLKKEAVLGIIPLGTGNDFVKALNWDLTNDPLTMARRLATGKTRSVDVGKVTVQSSSQECTRYFLNGLGMGLDAQVAVESLKLTKLQGLAVYLVAIIRALAVYKARPMTVRFDTHELRRKLLFANVANGRCQGNSFWLTPEALIDDGLLDVCTIDNMRLDQIIRHIPKLMEGTHMQLRQVTMGQAKNIVITCAYPTPVAADGEVVATDAQCVTVDVVPKAIQIIT